MSKLRLADFTDPVIYFLEHSERVREKVQDEIPAVWDPRAWPKVSSVAPASFETERDLFFLLSLTANLETLRITRKVPSTMKVLRSLPKNG